MYFSGAVRAYHRGAHKVKTRLSHASSSDRVAGALILAGTILATTLLVTESAHSASLDEIKQSRHFSMPTGQPPIAGKLVE